MLSIGGDNLQFYPNFALFSTLRGMKLDHDFFHLSKLSEDQEKDFHRKVKSFCLRVTVKTKKSSSPRNKKFLSPNLRDDQKNVQTSSSAQMQTLVKVLGGMQT